MSHRNIRKLNERGERGRFATDEETMAPSRKDRAQGRNRKEKKKGEEEERKGRRLHERSVTGEGRRKGEGKILKMGKTLPKKE